MILHTIFWTYCCKHSFTIHITTYDNHFIEIMVTSDEKPMFFLKINYFNTSSKYYIFDLTTSYSQLLIIACKLYLTFIFLIYGCPKDNFKITIYLDIVCIYPGRTGEGAPRVPPAGVCIAKYKVILCPALQERIGDGERLTRPTLCKTYNCYKDVAYIRRFS